MLLSADTFEEMQKWAQDPMALVYPIQGRAIFPEEVIGKTHSQLELHIRAKLAETTTLTDPA